jgi:hypothetical protein
MRWLLAFVAGAVICTALDHQHVVWGVLSYPSPDYWLEAWWVPLLFGCASVAALAAVEPMRRLLGGQPTAPVPGLAIIDVAIFVVAYYLTAVANHQPDVVAGVLFGAWLLRLAAGLPAWGVAYCIGAAMVGPAFEATWSGIGLFHYHHPDFLGVARWLPMLYLHVGVVAVSLGQKMPERAAAPIEVEVVV